MVVFLLTLLSFFSNPHQTLKTNHYWVNKTGNNTQFIKVDNDVVDSFANVYDTTECYPENAHFFFCHATKKCHKLLKVWGCVGARLLLFCENEKETSGFCIDTIRSVIYTVELHGDMAIIANELVPYKNVNAFY